MIKYAILLLSLAGVFTLGTQMDDGVIIEDNTPSTLAPGAETTVEISINKGIVEGFAKLQIELPDGLTASAVETNGASFTFSGQKVKFIWMALPDNQEFSVSYKLQASPQASGNKVITGTFSYIKDNQRIDYDMQTKMVEIAGEAANVADEQPLPNGIEVEGMGCVRTITEVSTGSYRVQLDVVNSTLQGFAKIKELLPEGFTASEDDSDGAVVTIEDTNIKYVWFEAPSAPNFSVSYMLQGAGDPSITGVFSFVENNAPKEVAVIDNGIVRVQETIAEVIEETTEEVIEEPETTEEPVTEEVAEVIEEPEVIEPEVIEQPEPEVIEEPEVVEPEVIEEPEPVVTEVPEETTADTNDGNSIPDAETGVSYKVQIMAAHRVVGEAYFASRHGYNEDFNIENHAGWVKYTTGSHDVYKSARDDRERIRNRYDFRGPFVTAYNYGERITVQEALMISKQKWYK